MNVSEIKKVTVAGCGTQGSQVASQVAYKGFDVTVWLRNADSIVKAKPRLASIKEQYLAALEEMKKDKSACFKGLSDKEELTDEELDEMIRLTDERLSGIKFETDLEKAFGDADVVIECIPEIPSQKKAFYVSAAPHFAERTLVLTDTSHLLPSSFAEDTGRPEKFTTLHFPNQMWKFNMAEIMRQEKTDPTYFGLAAEFAKALGMIPIILQKEWPGYILNSLCAPWYMAALTLCANGVADPATVDMTWQLSTGADPSQTPFRKLDKIGLGFVYNYARMDPDSQKEGTNAYKVLSFLTPYMEAGKTGVAAGEGFYKYKNYDQVE